MSDIDIVKEYVCEAVVSFPNAKDCAPEAVALFPMATASDPVPAVAVLPIATPKFPEQVA